MAYNLKPEIIILSNSKDWNIAKQEWKFHYAYKSEEAQQCLCGKQPIYNICVIRNIENGKETEVGNKCINKFLGIESGNSIFKSIKRLQDNIEKSLLGDAIEYLKEKNCITKWEYDFYFKIRRKHILSDKQMDIKKRINQKFLDFTSYQRKLIEEKFKKVNDFKNISLPDKEFVSSIKSQFQKKGKLSPKQIYRLEKIIEVYSS